MDPEYDSASNSSEGEDQEEEDEDIHAALEEVLISDAEGDEELSDPLEDEDEEELPPILEPPSTGYLHAVNENQPPPHLHLATGAGDDGFSNEEGDKNKQPHSSSSQDFEVVDLLDSDEGSSTTDSDDELVKVDYLKEPPEGFKKLMLKYKFLSTRDQWIYNVRSLYKKQPARIKRLLKMHKDVDGNPKEEPIEMLFERINAERERVKRAQNVKSERVEDSDMNGGEEQGVAAMVPIKVTNAVPRLTHVMYPGNVVNNDKAVATLGGMGTISKTFQQPNKKLMLKFRPSDPFANGANAQGRNACGLLLRVRRRKNRKDAQRQTREIEESKERGKINLDSLGPEPISAELIHDMLLDNQIHLKCNDRNEQSVTVNGKSYQQEDLLHEDRLVSDVKIKEMKTKKAWSPNPSKEYNLKLPKMLETRQDPDLQVETLGVVHRSYNFNGICDFQYLPVTKKADGTMVSIKDRIFPMLGSMDNPEKFVMKEIVNEEVPCQTFSLPPAMSRIDNPPRGLIDELIVSEKADSGSKRLPPDDSIFSNRMKRIIYTISYNFQADANSPEISQEIPSQPLSMALKDIERRQIKKDLIENVRMKFEERPIWSKVALEFATKIPSQTLKYIIPHFAYFAANGPWRNTWIKFGLDPRKNPIHVIYQSVDFRIPFIYRRFMNVGPKHLEASHKFLPEHIPPKTQMFYQLCDIKLHEITELIHTLESRAASSSLMYDERFGFLKEGSYEYFRYIMNYYLENLLQEHGKIPASNNPDVTFIIPPGHIEPEEKLKAAPHRRVKNKRMRRSTKKSIPPGATSGSPKGKGSTAGASRSYQETLEDLALNKLTSQSGSDDADFFEDEDEDDDDEEYLED